MTLLSPVEIVQQTWAPDGGDIDALMQWIGDGTNGGGLGWFSFGSARSKNGNVTESVLQRNELQRRIMAASAHHIPAAVFNEALHGANAGGTVFPELATQGATWDVDLIEEIGAAIAREARGCGIDTALSPVLNMWVDSRFGRLQEGYSENPTLTTAYAIAQAKGLQGAQPKGEWAYFNRSKVVALAKHYAAYGAALGGLNGAPAELSERTLREWYLRPWRAFAAAGGKGAMASHNTVLNQPMHANDYVTNQIFRKEFGFGEGVIVSDCNDVPALVSFRTAANLSQAAARGIKGGIDLDLQCTLLTNRTAYTHLEQAVADGLLSLEKIKVAAKRVLAQKYALGLFEEPFVDPAQAAPGLDTPAHRALALRAAEEGIVLLKNDKDMLPLSTAETGRGNSVAVIGANGGCEEGMMLCDGRTNLLGSYTQYIHYPDVNHSVVHVMTVAEALEEAMPGSKVEWALGATIQPNPNASQAAADRAAALLLAARSDVIVAVLGDDLKSSSEWGDRDNLDLAGDQMPLLHALADTGKPIVLVLVTGRTASFGENNSVLSKTSAILSTFRPGQMGGNAIANILTGKVNPSGKLAQNWLRNAGQSMSGASPWLQWRVGKWVANARSPPDPDGRVYDGYNDGPASPLFYFGMGLSYTTFAMDNLKVTPISAGHVVLAIELSVSNTGKRLGTQVVQVYCIDPVMEYVRPWKRLLAFARITLAPGTTETLKMDVTEEQMSFQDDSSAAGEWRVVPGTYQIRVGDSSVTDLLTEDVTIVNRDWEHEASHSDL